MKVAGTSNIRDFSDKGAPVEKAFWDSCDCKSKSEVEAYAIELGKQIVDELYS